MKQVFGFLVLLLFAFNAFSQSNCPAGKVPVVRNISYTVNGVQVCAVYVDNMLPNTPVTLFGPNLTVISTVSGQPVITDATGYACFIYPCNATPLRVNTCDLNGCCTAFIPAAAPLPIKLKSFSGKIAGGGILLNWTSVFEMDADKYVVERSDDGRTFTPVGEVKAAGSSYNELHYSFTDKSIANGSSYFYRLHQVDQDGSSEYSKVVYINIKNGTGIVTTVFPNPFKSDIQIVGLTQSQMNNNNIRLFDITGRRIPFTFTGANEISVDKSAPNGVYILKVKDQTFRIVKK